MMTIIAIIITIATGIMIIIECGIVAQQVVIPYVREAKAEKKKEEEWKAWKKNIA